jgi:hypothetical protein
VPAQVRVRVGSQQLLVALAQQHDAVLGIVCRAALRPFQPPPPPPADPKAQGSGASSNDYQDARARAQLEHQRRLQTVFGAAGRIRVLLQLLRLGQRGELLPLLGRAGGNAAASDSDSDSDSDEGGGGNDGGSASSPQKSKTRPRALPPTALVAVATAALQVRRGFAEAALERFNKSVQKRPALLAAPCSSLQLLAAPCNSLQRPLTRGRGHRTTVRSPTDPTPCNAH